MKHGLELTTISTSDIKAFKNDPRKFGIEKQLALFKKNNVDFEKMLDIWKQSGHNHTVGQEIVLKIRGN